MDDNVLTLGISDEIQKWMEIMVEYPHVIDVKGKRFMFYNGNGLEHPVLDMLII